MKEIIKYYDDFLLVEYYPDVQIGDLIYQANSGNDLPALRLIVEECSYGDPDFEIEPNLYKLNKSIASSWNLIKKVIGSTNESHNVLHLSKEDMEDVVKISKINYKLICTTYNDDPNMGLQLRNNWIEDDTDDSLLELCEKWDIKYPSKGSISNILEGRNNDYEVIHIRIVRF